MSQWIKVLCYDETRLLKLGIPMTQLTDLKILSPELEESGYGAFAQSLGWLDDREPFDVVDTGHDDFQALLTELKREALSQDVNPLIGAATFLFVRIFQLEQIRYRVEVNLLQQELVNKIKCFAYYAKEAGYHPNLVLAARYLLCAWIDEYLDSSPLGKEKSWIQEGLLKFFRFDAAGERFFLILKRCLDLSESHIDLLELIYLCLSFGFKGPYRYQPEGQKDLAIIIDHLYHHIRSVRGEFSKSLCVGEPGGARFIFNHSAPKFRVFLFPFLLSMVVSITFVVINHQLGEKLSPLFHKLSHLVA